MYNGFAVLFSQPEKQPMTLRYHTLGIVLSIATAFWPCFAVAADQDVVTIECRSAPKAPGATYHISMKVELSGSDHVYQQSFKSTEALSAEGFAALFGADIGQGPGWASKVDGKKLIIEGWKDPKTGKLYKVKDIIFKSDDLPKECMPTVSGLPKKA